MLKRICALTFVLVLASGLAALAGDLLPLVPESSNFVFGINLGKILKSPQIQKQVEEGMAKQTPEQKKMYDEFVQKTGLNPLQHLQQFVIFASGNVDPKEGKPEAGVLIEGTFDINKILAAIKSDEKAAADVDITKFEGFDCIKAKKESEGMALFLDGTTAVVGSPEALKSVAAIKGGKGKAITSHGTFGNLLKKVDVNASFWGVGQIPQSLKDKARENPQAAPLAALNAFFLAFNYDNDLSFNFTGEVDDKKNMDGVMTSLNGFLAMIKMIAGQTPEAAEILNLIKIEAVDTAAKISLSVPKAKLDEIQKKIQDRMKAAPQGGTEGAPKLDEGK
ncbi:MAG: hypothetical protein OZSIB_0698 [Candidatus Ozemobacter sibiricus]|jgi:hypothetical protein|uniref:DUF3352 domain-containing protein n=1 Tax=Candidatus Ozemobacter sibiricus TaxID=2268124 RepID=A0A367ZTT7_9BACT|nr:MAG: hypothetical protein OZSIB_0698 [Candidatus Ozemobacter sibiricus]